MTRHRDVKQNSMSSPEDHGFLHLPQHRLEKLVQIQQRMLRPIVWDEETDDILESIAQAVDAHSGVLWQRRLNEPKIILQGQGHWQAKNGAQTIDLTGHPLEKRILGGEEFWLEQGSSDENAFFGDAEGNERRLIPLISRERLLGLLVIRTSRRDSLTNGGGLEFLRLIAGALAMAFERRLYHRQLKESQSHLRQSQKMEALGQFAGGIAHDFNNILTVIGGYMILLQEELPPDSNSAQMAGEAKEAADRATELTKQLLTFAHKRKLELTSVDLNDVIAGIQPMLSRLLGETIRLEVESSKSGTVAKGDPHLIEQALMNLTANARDAMPEGGVVKLKIFARSFSKDQTGRPKQMKPQSYACIDFSDTGTGMSREVREHVFEPFFTTKAVGKGTGLGLATVYAIVQQHEGWVEIDSETGAGTTIRLFFPMQEPEATSSNVEPSSPDPSQDEPSKAETILLVEDEEAVLKLSRMVLEFSGYKVITAKSGAEALSAWEQCKHHVRLLMTDIVMPGKMSGIELAEKLCAEQPNLMVILVSGYSRDLNEVPTRDGQTVFLQKPYEVHDLKTTIRRLLDGSAPTGTDTPS